MSKFTIMFFSLVLAIVATGKLQAQTIIWGGPGEPNSTFDGGLNDWTVEGVSCSNNAGGQQVDGSNATWVWRTAPSSQGAYWGTQLPFASPSAANGAVIFDSDFLDNNGVAGAFKTGPCPAPHVAYLTSPSIDLTGQTSVALSFYQFYRRFAGPGGSQSAVASYVEVSNDGGGTWTTFTVNTAVAVNAATENPNLALVDISAIAANQPDVRIRFKWDGEYYYWMIDDVVLVTLPENNLLLNRHFFGPNSIFTPQAYTDVDTFLFSARASNIGSNNVTAILATRITNATNTQTFWADSITVNLRSGLRDTVILLPYNYVPEDLEPGEYRIRYELYQEGITDFNPSDNVRQSAFAITDNSYWQSGVRRGHVRPCFDPDCVELQPWAFGALLATSPNTVEMYRVDNVEIAVSGEASAADLTGKSASFYMLEILSDDFFETGTELGDGITNDFAAFGDIDLGPANHQQFISVEMEDAEDPDVPFILKNGSSYMGLVNVPQAVRIGYDNQFNNFPTNLADNSVLLKSRLFWGGQFRATFRDAMPYVRLNMLLVSTEDNNPLPEASVLLSPNPASSFVQVNINLETAVNATITLADMSGRVIKYENISNVTEHTHTLDVSQLVTGTYLVRVATPIGTSTQKLVVIK